MAHLVGHQSLNGVATSTKALIEAQIRAGHDVALVHPRKSWIGQQDFHPSVLKLDTSFSMAPGEILRVGRALRDWGCTVVHSHGSGGNKYAMVFRLVSGAPTVMTAHSRKFQLPWLFAHGVIGLSAPTIDYYLRRRLVARRRIFNIPNLFAADAYAVSSNAERAKARASLGIASDALVIGTVGAIGRRKRQVDVIAMLAELVRSGVDAQALLIGRPSNEEARLALDAAVSDPVVRGRVHLAGHRADAAALMPAFDLYVCASEVEEAPIAPLEAMAQGIPVLSTRVGNMPDLLPAAQLLDIGDVAGMTQAARTLLNDPAVAKAVATAGRETVVQKLAPALILPQIDAVYRMAMAPHARSKP